MSAGEAKCETCCLFTGTARGESVTMLPGFRYINTLDKMKIPGKYVKYEHIFTRERDIDDIE